MKLYYAVIFPTHTAPRMALQAGKVLIHLPNYLVIQKDRPVVADEAAQVISFRIEESLVHQVSDGGRVVHYIWAGEKGSRSRPQDLITVELVGAGSASNVSDEVRLAMAITHVPDSVLARALGGPDMAKVASNWAEGTLENHDAGVIG